MGTYINIGNEGFQRIRNSEYVDKSGLIPVVNKTLFTEQCFSCVSRCRRFGKSMAAKMLCAYYDRSCDSRSLFADLQAAQDPSFEKHLNKYPVIYLDMTAFVTRFHDDSIVEKIDAELRADVLRLYADVEVRPEDDLMGCLIRITEKMTDVNIADAMLRDAYERRADSLVLVSGDADLAPVLRTVRYHIGIAVLVFNPQSSICNELRRYATFYRNVPQGFANGCRLPDSISTVNGGTIQCPVAWLPEPQTP